MIVNHPLLEQPTEVEIVDESHEPWILVRCKKTDFHFIANPPTYDRLTEEFAWEKTIESARERRHSEEKLIRVVSTVAKKIKVVVSPRRNKMFDLACRVLSTRSGGTYRVLDVGCGNGKNVVRFCRRFQQLGIQIKPVGIEVSTVLAQKSRRKFSEFDGEVVENNAIDGMDAITPGSIDIVTMLSFLEHECRPLSLLRSIHKVLIPNGSVIVKVPNFNSWNRKVRGSRWAGYRFPDHVSYFTSTTLHLLAKQAGFVLRPQPFRDRLPTSDNMYGILTKAG